MSQLQIVKLVSNQETVIPVCSFKIKNVSLSVFITLKISNRPVITFMKSEWFTHEPISRLSLTEFVHQYACAYTNTIESHQYFLNGYQQAVNQSRLSVVDAINLHVDQMAIMPAIAFLKQLIKLGFAFTDFTNKLDILLELESQARYFHKKAAIIQRGFREVIANPSHPICIRRLLHEFNMLQGM